MLPPLLIQNILFLSLASPQVLPLRGSQVWISKSGILRAEVLESKLILKGEAEGSVFVSGISTGLQKVMVVNENNYQSLKKCGTGNLNFAKDLPALTVEKSRRETLNHLSHCGFEKIALDREAQKQWQQDIYQSEALLNQRGLKILKSTWNEQGQREVSLSGGADSALRAKDILGPLASIYKIKVIPKARPGHTLSFETTLFEYSRSKARSLGLRFPESIRLWPLEVGALATAEGSLLSLGLDFGEKEGVGKILARPKIRTQPGQKAIFQSGGELPVKNENLHSSSTVWKAYGLQIEIEPDAQIETGAQEVSLSFKIEVSEPDFGKAINGIPSISTRKLHNRFDLRVDEMTVLTSLIQLRKGKTEKGIAGLRDLPLLGGLFDNHTHQESESELYFALKPTWDEI